MPKKTFRQKQKRGSKKRSSKKRASQRGGVKITFEKRARDRQTKGKKALVEKARAPFLEPNGRLEYSEDDSEDEDSEDLPRPAEAAGDGPNSGDEDAYLDQEIDVLLSNYKRVDFPEMAQKFIKTHNLDRDQRFKIDNAVDNYKADKLRANNSNSVFDIFGNFVGNILKPIDNLADVIFKDRYEPYNGHSSRP